MPTKYRWWKDVKNPPSIGDEYNVVYDLEDGGEPVVSTMEYSQKENKWYDTRGAGLECKTVLLWRPLPKSPFK